MASRFTVAAAEPAGQRHELLPERVLHVLAGILQARFRLIPAALVLGVVIAGDLSDGLLGRPPRSSILFLILSSVLMGRAPF
ncbi:hypothetical protein X011_01915 [Mycobacterium tuberculosis variant microti OV254]|nr:hypothetical protein X011_01915 [Mycobacterium tuberculosis variant microti OV254]